MINISQSLGLPTIFIRYNPDDFKINNIVQDISFNNRVQLLKRVLKDTMELDVNNINGFVMIKKLFFDDNFNSNYYVIMDFNSD
jgi:hypothetical protein